MDIFSEIKRLIDNRESCVICTVVEAKGSTPRKPGSKLLVSREKLTGTVGGGDLEFHVIEKAKQILLSEKIYLPFIEKYNLGKDLKMACGGVVSIFYEPCYPKEQLIIFGAGHIGKALAILAQQFDFKIIISDSRKEVLSKLPDNVEKIHGNIAEIIKQISIDKFSYVLSVSHSHGIDLEVAKNIVEKNWAYFGIIASSRKSAMIKQQLIEAGFDREKIAKIDMPAGIEIKVEKPEEIALSVLAKIIDLRNRKRA